MSWSFRYHIVLGLTLALSAPVLAQAPSASGELTREQKEEFLRTARIVKSERLSVGITDSRRATLTDGSVTHDAHIQTVEVFKLRHLAEVGFTDSYRYNIAAYRLDKILGLGIVPVSVERKFRGKKASLTWWIDEAWMTEKERISRGARAPDVGLWNKQMYRTRVLDQLIYNIDRNLGNLVITKDWKIWAIDHTRAFRNHRVLKSTKDLVQCDRKLLAALRGLTDKTLTGELRPYVSKAQIKALLARRDLIVKYFDNAVAEKGEQAVLYDLPARL